MPRQTFSHAVHTTSSPAQVWRALQLPETWASIPGVDRVFDPVLVDGDLSGFAFESVAGGKRYLGRATPAGRVEGSEMSWHITTSEIRGLIKVSIDGEAGPGSRVTVELTVESLGVLSSMFFPVIAASIGSGFPRAVESFGADLR